MKRTGFARKGFEPRPARQWEGGEITPRTPLPRVMPRLQLVQPIVKDDPVRDKAYRMRVAALPCINCGIAGISQAAHGPSLGARIKCSDEILFPLCADQPLRVGCHTRFDQYQLFDAATRIVKAIEWAARTRAQLSTGGA